ncbi:hypothetical protein PM082_011005 [Marasmius tenuissimus]|nr:hypothetical protein PM082_011005 [Marasmius tenuissimus]
MPAIPQIKLNTGAEIPGIALGCAPAPFTPDAIDASKNWMLTALKAGYRHFDTAQFYKTEASLGKAIRESGIPREEITITTKLSPHRGGQYVERAFNDSLETLGVDYVDLFLIHFPQVTEYRTGYEFPETAEEQFGGFKVLDKPDFHDTWAALEKIHQSGQAKAIGVSNFSVKTLEALARTQKVVPAVNQVEMTPYLSQEDLLEYCQSKGIIVMAYGPSGHQKVRSDPTIVAMAQEYNASPNQVILAWHIARGVLPIPKSSNPERQKENITLPTLSPKDIEIITALDRSERILSKAGPDGKMFGWTFEQYGWK